MVERTAGKGHPDVMEPFRVTKETVAPLGDEALRELLVRLLEAEARNRGIDQSAIRAGGNQTAPDGGVDVALHWTGDPAPGGWLPARDIAFQCKAERMRPADLRKEMRSGDGPRPLFANLAERDGAYVVFTTDDPAGTRLDERMKAMREVASEVSGGKRIELRFLGADHIARWTNQHIGVALWLLSRSGRSVTGWRPYGDWSAPGSTTGDYISSSEDRILIGGVPFTSAEALETVRDTLREAGGAVRLIGISGMGKTRFAEAIFDERVGNRALHRDAAIYADVGHDLAISVPVLAEQLAGAGVTAVIVADNCPGSIHAQVSTIVSRPAGRTSLLTIDHELDDSGMDGSLVVRMGDNSPEALAGLLAQRCPWLTGTETSHLADFAGGNARVALKIAEGSRDGVDISSLNDSQMLDRLFQTDRGRLGSDARRCADAASLVYAFHADARDHAEVEHPVLAVLAGVGPDAFYGEVSRLVDFGIAQRRGPQRAIMPPPIANMLAATMIRRSDPASLLAAFQAAPPRLFKSFARRLGYLHSVPEAVSLAKTLLAPGGALGDPATLQGEMRTALMRLAPASPADAVEAIARALAGPKRERLVDVRCEARRDFAMLLAQIAHDDALFARAMETMLPFVVAESGDQGRHSVADYFHQRFWPRLSFTLATQETRLAFIDRLLDDDDERVRLIGVECLDRMLDTYFSSSMDISFGARALTRQWYPRGQDGYDAWCKAAYERLVAAAFGSGAAAGRAREVVAHNFRQQLSAGGNGMPVEAMKAVRGLGYWDAGWNAICEALSFRRGSLSLELVPSVVALERAFRPATADELFEAFVLGEPWRHWRPSGREHRSTRDVARLARRFGACVAGKGVAANFLERAIGASGQTSVYDFARGLGDAVSDPDEIWFAARDCYSRLPPDGRGVAVLAGLLAGMAGRDERWVQGKLDDAAGDPELGPQLVTLHLGVPIDRPTMRRFTAALRDGSVAPPKFEALMYGGVSKAIPADELAAFLRELFSSNEGALTALQILHMRIFGDREDKRAVAPELIELAMEFVTDTRSYVGAHARADHGLETLAGLALSGSGAEAVARAICRALANHSGSNEGGQRFGKLCMMLTSRFTTVVLDEIVGAPHPDGIIDEFFGGIFRDDDDGEAKDALDEDAALAWVAQDPGPRANRLAEFVPYFRRVEDADELEWSAIALILIDTAPDPVQVLETLERRFWSGSGSGTFASRFVRRRPLVAAMARHAERRVRNWAREASLRLEEDIRRWDEEDARSEGQFE